MKKKKRTSAGRRLVTLALALAMVFTMLLSGVTAEAAGSTININETDTSLTIHKYSGDTVLDSDTYPTQSAMANAAQEAVDAGELEPLEDVVFSYLLVGDVEQGTDDDGNITIGYIITNDTLLGYLEGTGELVTAFTDGDDIYYTPKSLDDALAVLDKTTLESFILDDEDTKEMLGTNSSGISTVTDIPVGLYLVVETGSPATVTTTTQPFFVSIPMTDNTVSGYEWIYNVHAYPKNIERPITIEKSVVEDGDESKNIDGEIGQVKEFVIRAVVPGAIANMAVYRITDTLSDGLTFQDFDEEEEYEPVVRGITADGEEVRLTEGTHYTFSQSGQTLTFEFITSAMGTGSEAAYVQVEISYFAYLNENAVVGGSGNSNNVELRYSTTTESDSDSEEDTTTTAPTDIPVIYTYAIDLTKYGDGDTDNVLSGVQFELYRANDSEDPDYDNSTKVDVALSTDRTYYYVIGNNDGTDTPITTDENGKIDLRGLEAGTYYLVETETTGSYNLLKDPIDIVITSNEGSYTQSNVGTYAPYETGYTYYTDDTLSTPFILPDEVQAGQYVNFGTSTVYKSNNPENPDSAEPVTMYSPDELTWSVTVAGETVISDGEGGNTDIGGGTITISVNNSTGFQLPSTGGNGIYLIIIIGAGLVAVAAVMLTRSLRRDHTQG